MIKQIMPGIIFALLLLLLAGCGGGTAVETPGTIYTKAIIKVSLSGDLGGKAIAGVRFTLTLPANVTPEMVNAAVAAVKPSGTFAGGIQTPPVYVAATATTPGTVQIAMANTTESGVTVAGEVATISLLLTNGVVPVVADFALNSVPVTVIDTLGNTVAGMTATVSGVTLQ